MACLGLGCAVGDDPGQIDDLGDPAAVVFAFDLIVSMVAIVWRTATGLVPFPALPWRQDIRGIWWAHQGSNLGPAD